MTAGTRPLQATVIVPTRNESRNVAELVERLDAALGDRPVEVLFVDDSTDDTRAEIARAAAASRIPVRLLERAEPDGGLGGAALRPRGFKILLEILVRTPLRLREIPLVLEARRAGTPKGDFRQGARLAAQIAVLRLSVRRRP